MSEYPINSTAKVYFDTDGNEVTLRQLIKLEPEWAHSRIQAGERAETERDQLRAELEKERERVKRVKEILAYWEETGFDEFIIEAQEALSAGEGETQKEPTND